MSLLNLRVKPFRSIPAAALYSTVNFKRSTPSGMHLLLYLNLTKSQ